MTDPDFTWASRLEAYWEAEGRQTAADQLVGTCWFVLLCQFAFIGLDRWVFPDQFAFFLSLRLAVNVAVVSVLLRFRNTHPNECQIAVPALVGIEILAMIYAGGDTDSLYFAGLILVMVGTPVLQPISVRGSLLISSICVGGFVSCAAMMPNLMSEQTFAIEFIFVLAAALESGFSCRALAISRVVAFEQRREIEETRDQLASLDDAKSRFSANIHHELRTPLTLILAPLETLRSGDMGDLPASIDRTLRTMYINGQRLLKLINNLLDLAKLESDKFSIHRREVDLESVVENLVEAARPMAERKRIALSVEAQKDLPRTYLDTEAVEKIVVNLLSNALKFTASDGSVSVRVGATEDLTKVYIRVLDTGIGLAKQDMDRIFDRFAQADESTTREHEGTGIGLALTKELVELHAGRIWAESEGVGHGSLMCVEFPVGESDQPMAEDTLMLADGSSLSLEELVAESATDSVPSQENALATELERDVDRWESLHEAGPESESSEESDRKPNIVVADDNSDMRELIKSILGREFAVHVASNGRRALDLTRTIKPDLVVTDIMMPEMSGTELCRAIKTDPNTVATPVMLVSSKADGEMKVEGLELGADDYVTKPFHPRELLARARGLVKLRRLQHKVEARNKSLETALEELKSAEAILVQSERLAAVGEIAAGIAHEVNNPVNFALNAVRALRANVAEIRQVADTISAVDWDDDSKRGDQLRILHGVMDEIGIDEAASNVEELGKIIADGLERTRLLVADLQNFASPETATYSDVDLGRGIRSTAALLRPSITNDLTSLEVEIDEALPNIKGNASALNQVVLNLIKNAADALGKAGGSILVDAKAYPERIDIRVIDNGPGINEVAVRRIFEPFFTTKIAGTGTGLGLSISRQIATSHGGSLTVESEPGSGTTFTLSLPLTQN
jgi:signal transduction histidine kinase